MGLDELFTKDVLQKVADLIFDFVDNRQCCTDGNNDKKSRSAFENAFVDTTEPELDDGVDIPLSDCHGNKKSLFIGINYIGTKCELRGCINDVKNIKSFVVKNFNFPTDSQHMRTLVDTDPRNMPTRSNILQALEWLKQGARPGDSLFLHYSGHGGSQQDLDGDEADGMDETLIPIDFEKAGVIVDDELHEILVAGLPQGVRLTAIMDCCHSGSVLDLPFTYAPDGKLEIQEIDNRKAAIQAGLAAGMNWMQGNKQEAIAEGVKAVTLVLAHPTGGEENKQARQKQIAIRSTVADVIQFSGCRDEQTSADADIGGNFSGAMSWSFIEAFRKHGKNQTFAELLGNVRTLLYGKYTQIPQMSVGHRMNVKTTKFTM